MRASPRDAFSRVLRTLDDREIPYFLVGSGASSTHGLWRASADIDLVAQISADDADALVKELESEFYIDAEQIRDALARGRSFNVIHFESGFKFDIFPLTDDPYQQSQFSRRQSKTANLFGGSGVQFFVSSPEDVILSKLAWYRSGGEVSQRQWTDVLSVLAVQRDKLDLEYLTRWSAHLGVADLLVKARSERHEPPDRQ